ncbi:MAG TPA: tetratricopeptide repeat protein, partial [Candidatus Kapabacteria bacterium]|nr:tetratricopeptide repeat protein [Candidatus Kapabacteria bacterium]
MMVLKYENSGAIHPNPSPTAFVSHVYNTLDVPQNQSELRIFVSSTFHDLEEEREYLVKRVFPEIRQLCRERGVEFTEIDLRWGLTEEEATHGKIIRTCLEEIDRCRPYFIGILGERYGWSPKFHEVQKDADLIRKYPWIEDAAADGASIVEMEFDYGVLQNPAAAIGAYFYFRKPGHRRVSDESSKKLDTLKKRARASKRPAREFSSTTELGELVRRDLKQLIEEQWYTNEPSSIINLERSAHEAFASSRRRAYIVNPVYLKHFDRFAEGANESTPLVISGISGSGKSSLIAYLAKHYLRHNPDAFVIEHYIGASTTTSDYSGVLRHICLEIKDRLSIEDEIPTSTEELAQTFPSWLAKVQNEKFLVFIDALNQLEGGASLGLGWLPEYLPPNVRLICSTTEGEPLEALRKRNLQELKMHPIDEDERESIIVRFLGEYHKALSHKQTKLLASDPKSASPLFLRTVLEELRILGIFEGVESHISHYLEAGDLNDLFKLVLERMEHDYGELIVAEIMTLLWSSRHGLSETELLDLFNFNAVSPDDQPVTRLDLSMLLSALDFHLIRKDGRIGFFHNYLRDAVETRYLSEGTIKCAAHCKLATYFRTHPVSKRRVDEEPWQWQQAEEWEELRDTLVDVEAFPLLASKERQYELLGYWRKLKGKYDITSEYLKMINIFYPNGIQSLNKQESLSILSDFFVVCGMYDLAESTIIQAIDCAKYLGGSSIKIAKLEEKLGDIYFHKSEYELAEQIYSKLSETFMAELGPLDPQTIDIINSRGITLGFLGRRQEAIMLLSECLHNIQSDLQPSQNLSPLLANLAHINNEEHQYDRAIDLIEKCISIVERENGLESTLLIQPLHTLGIALRNLDEFSKSKKTYKRAVSISLKYLGHSHPL